MLASSHVSRHSGGLRCFSPARHHQGTAGEAWQGSLAEDECERVADAPRRAREARRERKGREGGPEEGEREQANADGDEHQAADVLRDAVPVGRRRRDEAQGVRALRARPVERGRHQDVTVEDSHINNEAAPHHRAAPIRVVACNERNSIGNNMYKGHISKNDIFPARHARDGMQHSISQLLGRHFLLSGAATVTGRLPMRW